MSQSNPPTENQPEFVLLDEKGRQFGLYPKLKPPFSLARPLPNWDMNLSVTPSMGVVETDDTADKLTLLMTYMAQSDVGLRAVKTLSSRNIGLVFDNEDLDQKFGYNADENKIVLNPRYDLDVQHLHLIEYATHAEAYWAIHGNGQSIQDDVMKFYAESVATIAGAAVVIVHSEQCLVTAANEPDRFVPPLLESALEEFFSETPMVSWEEAIKPIEETGSTLPLPEPPVAKAIARLLYRLDTSLEAAQSNGKTALTDHVVQIRSMLSSYNIFQNSVSDPTF